MEQKIKNYLGWTMILVMLVVGFSFAKWVKYYSKSIDPSSVRSFSVSAEGEAISIPDVAQFTFSVINEGGLNVTSLQESNINKTNQIIDFLKSEGVAKEDIKTQNYDLQPRYQYYSCPRNGGVCPPAEVIGYTINQTISVKIRNFEKAGDILANTVQKGASSVSQLNFTIDDPTSIQDKARGEAIEKAKEKAKSIAKAGGFRLGQLLSIQERDYSTPVYERFDSAIGIGGGLSVPKIEPGSQETKVTVTLIYEIR